MEIEEGSIKFQEDDIDIIFEKKKLEDAEKYYKMTSLEKDSHEVATEACDGGKGLQDGRDKLEIVKSDDKHNELNVSAYLKQKSTDSEK